MKNFFFLFFGERLHVATDMCDKMSEEKHMKTHTHTHNTQKGKYKI